MVLPLQGVHVEHVHAVLHAVVGGPVAGETATPTHHPRHAPLCRELGEKLRIEVHPTGSLAMSQSELEEPKKAVREGRSFD